MWFSRGPDVEYVGDVKCLGNLMLLMASRELRNNDAK